MSDTVFDGMLAVVMLAAGLALGCGLTMLARQRRRRRRQDFFGLPDGSPGVLVTPGSDADEAPRTPRERIAALLELAAVARRCGSRVELVPCTRLSPGVGARTEFCLGGPEDNDRVAAHLRWTLPGVLFDATPSLVSARDAPDGGDNGSGAPENEKISADSADSRGDDGESAGEVEGRDTSDAGFRVAATSYRDEPGSSEYVLLARVHATSPGHPVFLCCARAPVAEHAAARWLAEQAWSRRRRPAATGTWCVVLRVVNSATYGADVVELVADVSAAARTPAPRSGAGETSRRRRAAAR